ncbi:hypothetical protein IJI72_03340 [Candidatus Saccharibacteria bacterium]|nr:hypothetical protein [Candidatus Saccharibacteria bacterium]
MCTRAEAHEVALGIKKVQRQSDLIAHGTKNLDALTRHWEYELQVAKAEQRRIYREFSRVQNRDRARAEIASVVRLDVGSFMKVATHYLEIIKEVRWRTQESVPYVPFLRPTTYLKEGDTVHDLEGIARVTQIEAEATYQTRRGLKPEVWVHAERVPKDSREADDEGVRREIRFSLWDETVFRGDEWLYLKQHREAKYLILSSFEGVETAYAVKEALNSNY